jgi:hypothetical protein
MNFPYDRSGKWLLDHFGGPLLRLAGVLDVVAWKTRQAEVIQPSQAPDGLLEVRRAGQMVDELYLVEVATYPERRVVEQLTRGAMLVYLD